MGEPEHGCFLMFQIILYIYICIESYTSIYIYVYHVQLYIHNNFDMFAMFSSLIIDMTRIRGFLRQI